MVAKRPIRTNKAVPKRSLLHNEPIDYPASSKWLASELEKLLATYGVGEVPASVTTSSDVSKVFKSFSLPKPK